MAVDMTIDARHSEARLQAEALQAAVFNSAHFSKIATDAEGVIQIFNIGAERMLGYTAADVLNRVTPADFSDPRELIARAKALSLELGTTITPGFEALVFKASRGIEDIYELTYVRKDGSRFPAVVSVTGLRDAQDAIIGYLLIGTDNTARKQAEEAQFKAAALQRAILNSAHFSSIATDAAGVIQIFNVGAERMLGYDAADVLNRITPADISDPHELIARAETLSVELGTAITPGFEALVFKASRGIEDIYELTYIRKDGSRLPAVVSVTGLRDAQDAIIGYLLIGTDNTARKLVEAKQKQLDQLLRDQQFYARSLLESTLDALMATNPGGVITDVNQQMEALTGWTRDDLIGTPFKNYFTDPERAEAGIKLVLEEKKVADYELTACARDGRKTDVSYNATTFYHRDGTLRGVFASARDMTYRKHADEELRLANARMSALAEALDSFAIVEVTDTEGRITYANETFCRTSKYSSEELLGRDHRDVGGSGHHSREFWETMWSTIRRGQTWRGEIKNRAKDGTSYWVDTAIVPRLGSGGEIEAYMVIRFVTTERNMLEQVRKDALQAKEEVLSHVSHELRTPLAAIDWFATNLRVGLLGGLTPDQCDHLDTILKNVKQLEAMIGDFLDATRASTGKLSIARRQMKLATVVGEAVATCESMAVEAAVVLQAPVASNLPMVWADPDRTRQVLINLINNAVKFTSPGGVVTVQGQVTGDRDFVRMSVMDTGCGITEENCAHVFERLFQQSGESEASRKGLGLGLFISREIVGLQGGRLSVESKIGRGSTFSFTVPIYSPRRMYAPVLTARNLEAGRMTVITLKTFPLDETADAMVESRRTTRAMLEGSILAGQDLVVPDLCGPGSSEPFLVVAGTDGVGAEVIMARIREHLTDAAFSQNVTRPPTLSMTVVEFPKPTANGFDQSVANVVDRLSHIMANCLVA